jgi:hypothetical protein
MSAHNIADMTDMADMANVVAVIEHQQNEEAKLLIRQGDEAVGRGDLEAAVSAYERATALHTSVSLGFADDIARSAIADLAKKRMADAARGLNTVLDSREPLSPVLQDGLLRTLQGRAPREVSEYVARVLKGTASTGPNQPTSLHIAWHRDGLTTIRDVKVPASPELADTMLDISQYTVYVDDRLRVGHEGLLRELFEDRGGWRKHAEIRVHLLGSIGELPGVLHETTSNVFASRKVKRGAPLAGLAVLVSLRDGNAISR